MNRETTDRMERDYLISLMFRQTMPEEVRVDTEDMSNPAYAEILQSIYDCDEAFGCWEWAIVLNHMYQNRSKHTDVMEAWGLNIEIKADAAPRAQIVKQLGVERRYHEAAQRIVAANKEGRYADAAEIGESMVDIKPIKKEKTFETIDLSETITAAKTEVRETMQGKSTKVKFCEPILDRWLGGLEPGAMMTVGGSTSAGKSSFVLKLAVGMAKKGKRVAILSLEDPKSLWGKRSMGLLAGINVEWLYGGVALGEDAIREFSEMGARAELQAQGLPIRVSLATGPKASEAITEARKLVKRYDPDVFFVDYVQAPRFDQRARVGYDKLVADFAKQMKGLAVQYNIPLILVSQFKRPDSHREPTMHDLKETGDLEIISEIVMLLWKKNEGDVDTHGKIAKVKWALAGQRFMLRRDPAHGMVTGIEVEEERT